MCELYYPASLVRFRQRYPIYPIYSHIQIERGLKGQERQSIGKLDLQVNSPFHPSCLKPLYQSEAWCTTIQMKIINLHVNEILFSSERMGSKTRFAKETKDNSEMTYYSLLVTLDRYLNPPNDDVDILICCATSVANTLKINIRRVLAAIL